MKMRHQTSSIQTKNGNTKTTAFWDLICNLLLIYETTRRCRPDHRDLDMRTNLNYNNVKLIVIAIVIIISVSNSTLFLKGTHCYCSIILF